jgi:hypothetical protein
MAATTLACWHTNVHRSALPVCFPVNGPAELIVRDVAAETETNPILGEPVDSLGHLNHGFAIINQGKPVCPAARKFQRHGAPDPPGGAGYDCHSVPDSHISSRVIAGAGLARAKVPAANDL